MIRRLLVAALFACTMIAPAAVTTATPTPAVPPRTTWDNNHMYYYDYYSDSTYTQLVGQAWRRCNLEYVMMWGQETPYMSYSMEPCWA